MLRQNTYPPSYNAVSRLKSTKGASDRNVPIQPLYFLGDDKTVTRYNLRKLNETPFHLIRSSRYDDLYKEVLFNFRWLHAKLKSMSLQVCYACLYWTSNCFDSESFTGVGVDVYLKTENGN